MGGGTAHTASVLSSNSVEFGFPYAGIQHASLSLRDHPRYGKDVIFLIERGQLMCSPLNGCAVTVRFDEGGPEIYRATSAADRSRNVVFINDHQRFVSKLSGSRRARITMEVFREGAPMFEFEVGGFDQRRFLGQD
jgi:hypothetical protein